MTQATDWDSFLSPYEYRRIAKSCGVPDELVQAFVAIGMGTFLDHPTVQQQADMDRVRALAKSNPAIAQGLRDVGRLELKANKAALREAREHEAEAEEKASDIAIQFGMPEKYQGALVALLVWGPDDLVSPHQIDALLKEARHNPSVRAVLDRIAAADVMGAECVQEALRRIDIEPRPGRHR